MKKKAINWNVVSSVYEIKYNSHRLDNYFKENIENISTFLILYGEDDFQAYLNIIGSDESLNVMDLIAVQYRDVSVWQACIYKYILLL